LGGKLMRTVSFFGWTLPDSRALGGTAAEGVTGGTAPGPGGVGLFSAIVLQKQIADQPPACQFDNLQKLSNFAPCTFRSFHLKHRGLSP
jgi:hypothetical protein